MEPKWHLSWGALTTQPAHAICQAHLSDCLMEPDFQYLGVDRQFWKGQLAVGIKHLTVSDVATMKTIGSSVHVTHSGTVNLRAGNIFTLII